VHEHVTLPNLVTTGNLMAGFAALVVLPASAPAATLLVVLAAALDAVDGTMARRTGKDQTFGAGLDSLADVVSFGVVPAMAVYLTFPDAPSVLRLPVAAGFLACGVWRLARFPLVKQSRSFVGLPIPVAGLLVLALTTWAPVMPPVLAATVMLSALMVSRVPFPTVNWAAAQVSALAGRSAPRRWRRRVRLRVRHWPSRRNTSGPGRAGRRLRPPRVGVWARAELSRARRIAGSARSRRRSDLSRRRWARLRPGRGRGAQRRDAARRGD
jgi:CDP-diacylglycerol--serine O-phosphatidyltransferase